MPPADRIRARFAIPLATVSSCPLEHLQVALKRGDPARGAVPRAAVFPGAPEELYLSQARDALAQAAGRGTAAVETVLELDHGRVRPHNGSRSFYPPGGGEMM